MEENPTNEVEVAETTDTNAEAKVEITTEAESKAGEETTILGDAGKEEETKDGDSEDGSEETSEVPESYEFKLPEGMELDQSLSDQVTPIFKEIGLSQDQAQKLVDVYAPYVQTQVEAQNQATQDAYKETVNGWEKETKELLGSNFEKEVATTAKALDKFGTPELRALMNETGLGNHPEMVKAWSKVGKAISEDHFPDPNNQKVVSEGIDASKLYPSMTQ